jgi:tRNA(His) 5'-end guanylyltransferase
MTMSWRLSNRLGYCGKSEARDSVLCSTFSSRSVDCVVGTTPTSQIAHNSRCLHYDSNVFWCTSLRSVIILVLCVGYCLC